MKLHSGQSNPKIFQLILTAIFGLTISFQSNPSKAFVPYLYEPEQKDLKATSLSIAKTAAQLIQLGQPDEAMRLARLAVRIEKNDDRLWAVLAEAQLRTNQLSAAKFSLQKAKRINPNNASLWFAEASIEIQEKNTKKAILLLNKGLKLDPKNAGGYFHLGNAHVMQSNLNDALISFKKASELKPTFWEALNNKGLVLFEMGKPKDSIKIWRKVLEINSNAEPMLALAAALNQYENKNLEALKLTKKALLQNPNYVSSEYQEKQLWGNKLRAATNALLALPKLQSDVARAKANSDL